MSSRNYKNVIYILTNPLYAGYIKIGYASDLNARLCSLNTGMLRDFEPYAVYETDVKNADKSLHAIIDDLAPIVRARVVNGQKVKDKEFFKLEPEQAYELLRHIAVMTATEDKLHKKGDSDNSDNTVPHVAAAANNDMAAESDKGAVQFTLSMYGLNPGDEIAFAMDASKKAVVIDDKHISYNGEKHTLTSLAKQFGNSRSANGAKSFTYNGRLLWDIRNDMLKSGTPLPCKPKKERFLFSMCGLKAGDEIVFVRDVSKIAVIVDDVHVSYNGSTYSLSGLARELLHESTGKYSGRHGIQVTKWFMYNGKTLLQMRKDANL